MSTHINKITTSNRSIWQQDPNIFLRFILILISVFLVACGQSSAEKNNASLIVPWPQVESAKGVQNSTLAKSAESTITQIVITVQDSNNAELSRGIITNPSQALTINIPAGIPLSVSGIAYSQDEIVYQGKASVNPVLPSSEFQVNLILNPLWKLDIATAADTDAKNNLANGASGVPFFAQDEKSIFFISKGTNLVVPDTNDKPDIFLKTLNTGSIVNVHSSATGESAAKDAIGLGDWAISSSGEQVAFVSSASNLVAGDNNQAADLFLKNTKTGDIQRLISANGALSAWSGLSMNSDGSKIAFFSSVPLIGVNDGAGMYILDVATKAPRYIGAGRAPLISGDGKAVIYRDVAKTSLFIFDALNEKIDLIDSVTNGRQIVNYAISQDNRFIVYSTAAVNQEGTISAPAVFLYNRSDDSVKLISTDTKNRPVLGSWSSTQPSPTGTVTVQVNDFSSFILANDALIPVISKDGKYVVFEADTKIYVKDTASGVTTMIARAGVNPSISPQGTYIAYTATNDKHLYVEPNPLLHSPSLALAGDLLTQAGRTSVALSWKPIPGAVSYNIYSSTKPGLTKDNYATLEGIKYENVDSPFIANNLIEQTTYFFVVTASNGVGVETTIATPQVATTNSAPPSTTPPLLPKPATPVGLKAVPLAEAVQLDWSSVEGVRGYNLYWSTRPGVGINGRRISVVQPTLLHERLASGTTYYYVITSLNDGGESLPSPEVSVRLPIVAPTNVLATPSNNAAQIQWGQVSGATSYAIYIAPSSTLTVDNFSQVGGFKFENVKSPFTVPQTLNNGQIYFVLVEAKNELGERTLSAISTVTPGPTAVPSKPKLVATAKQSAVELKWDPVSTAQSYNLLWSTNPDVATNGTLIQGVTSPFVHTGLTDGTTYFYVLAAINQVGSSPLSDQVQALPDMLISELNLVDKNLDQCVKGLITREVTRALQITNLTCSKKNVNSLEGIEVLKNLTNLDLQENQISDVTSLSGLVKLTSLNLISNKIDSLDPLSNLVNLENLAIDNNGFNAAKNLSVEPLRNLIKLKQLSASNNGISDISALAGLTALTNLNLSDNQIVSISAVANLTKVDTLNLSVNKISDISTLTNLLNIKVLNLSTNEIADISGLAALTKLTELTLNNNQITDVQPLSGAVALEKLSLSSNKVTDINFLAGLAAIVNLQLNNNLINDVNALGQLSGTTTLNLNTNQIRAGVSALASLKNAATTTAAEPAIDLRNNPEIPCGDAQSLEGNLPDDGAAETGKAQWDASICIITPPIIISPLSAAGNFCQGPRGKFDDFDDEDCPPFKGKGRKKT